MLYRWIPRIIIAATPLLSALPLLAWYLLSPWWAVHELRSAVVHGRSGELGALIVPYTVCENLLVDMQANRLAKLAPSQMDDDAVATSNKAASRDAHAMCAQEPLTAALAGTPIPTMDPRIPLAIMAEDSSITRDGLSTFRLHRTESATRQGDLIFDRDGIGWKLVRIQLTTGE